MAVETSKNIDDIAMKVLYQLRAIEAFMEEMGIAFSRDFDLNIETHDTILHTYGDVVVNDRFLIPLDGIDKILRNVPLKPKGNRITRADAPLAALQPHDQAFDVMVGHRKITTLYPDTMPIGEKPSSLTIVTDGKRQTLPVPSRFTFHKTFRIEAPAGYRVNVIGFSQKGLDDENRHTIEASKLRPRYAMDRANRLFRVELYRDGKFCGMVIAEKARP
jgi:hypothetical protein